MEKVSIISLVFLSITLLAWRFWKTLRKDKTSCCGCSGPLGGKNVKCGKSGYCGEEKTRFADKAHKNKTIKERRYQLGKKCGCNGNCGDSCRCGKDDSDDAREISRE
ncbi:MAG: hypothetical protein M0R00_05790 [Candidatus Omnitrophica bacterium]|nr:hypothetical protein [Candidatus Omnitrophota bacterium]